MNSEVTSVEIGNSSLRATIVDFGASLADLRLNGCAHSLVLGYPDIQRYPVDGQYMGAVIGQYANRIAGGELCVNDKMFELERNESGINHLHGGSSGFGERFWKWDKIDESSVSLILSSDGCDMGYPGNMDVVARYHIIEPATLALTVSAVSDADTLVNICHHPYFNLDNNSTIEEHGLRIHSDTYLPSDDRLLPIGEIAPVQHSRFDFTSLRLLRSGVYNNTYCLHRQRTGMLTHAASVVTANVSMQLWTTQPGLHLYDGYKLKPSKQGNDNRAYAARAGLCLEAQAWPDSPNHQNFPEVTLKKGERYSQTTEYRFTQSG